MIPDEADSCARAPMLNASIAAQTRPNALRTIVKVLLLRRRFRTSRMAGQSLSAEHVRFDVAKRLNLASTNQGRFGNTVTPTRSCSYVVSSHLPKDEETTS